MKSELKALLESKEGTLELNPLFVLKRCIIDPEEDFLGRSWDYLVIEMNNPLRTHRDIASRDAKGIMEEVAKYMEELMDSYKEDLVRRFNGGKIGKLNIKEQ